MRGAVHPSRVSAGGPPDAGNILVQISRLRTHNAVQGLANIGLIPAPGQSGAGLRGQDAGDNQQVIDHHGGLPLRVVTPSG